MALGSRQSDGYPVALVIEAREMSRVGGWQPMEIIRIWASEGITPLPSPSTVRWWLQGSRNAQQQMEHQRRYGARRRAAESGGRLRGRASTPEFKFTRLEALSKLRPRLSHAQIASVLEFDFGDEITADAVRYALVSGHYPKKFSRLAVAA